MNKNSKSECNCFCVVAGRNTTVDGSVLMAHNEDDSGEMMMNLYASPRGEKQYGFLWAEFPGTDIVDHFLNEWGVAFASDGCPSREDREDYTEGGILYGIRLEGAKHARTAREGVKFIGSLVEKYGYRDSGRTYAVADVNEAWICSIVRGRHWVAQRIPDDKAMALPNNYIIDRVDLQDSDNFMACPDLVEYAAERGWYDPERDGEFSFKRVYGAPKSYVWQKNVVRQMCAQQLLTGRTDLQLDPDTLPLFVTPNRKLGITDMMAILQCHGENTSLKFTFDSPETPWTHPLCICNDETVMGAVFHLRGWMPREVGCVMWVCPGHPCAEPFVPLHLGVTEIPARWRRCGTAAEAERLHFEDAKDLRKRYPDHAYWKSAAHWEGFATDWHGRIGAVQTERNARQQYIFEAYERLEHELAQYCNGNQVTDADALHRSINAFVEDMS